MFKFRDLTISAAIVVTLTAMPAHADLVKKESPYPVNETAERLEAVLKEKNLTVFGKIDHAAGAKKVNQELRPTLLLIFGSPAAGTPLIQAEQTMGLSLPLKILIWQDVSGKVWLGYDTPVSVAAVRNVAKDHPAIGRITGALAGIADAAVKK